MKISIKIMIAKHNGYENSGMWEPLSKTIEKEGIL